MRLCAGVSKSYVFFYLLGLSFPYVHLLFLIWIVFEIFTPIMGRSGTEIPPDVVLASLITMATALISSFLVSDSTHTKKIQIVSKQLCICPKSLTSICLSKQIHFLYLAGSTKRVLAGLWTIFAVMFVLVSCGVFFPYSGDPASPRPKRVIIQASAL